MWNTSDICDVIAAKLTSLGAAVVVFTSQLDHVWSCLQFKKMLIGFSTQNRDAYCLRSSLENLFSFDSNQVQ